MSIDIKAAGSLIETANTALRSVYALRARHSPTTEWRNRMTEIDNYFVDCADPALAAAAQLLDAVNAAYQRGRDDLRATIDALPGPAVGDDPVAIAKQWNGDSGNREPDFDMNPDDTASFLAGHVIEMAAEIERLRRQSADFVHAVELARRYTDARGKGGQHVSPTHDFASLTPGAMSTLERWAREFKALLPADINPSSGPLFDSAEPF